MAITNGTQASRVKSPNITNVAQNTSANSTIASDGVEPMPNGSEKCAALEEKCISLSRPCCISISDPAPRRNTSIAKAKALSETPVLNSFRIQDILTGKFTATISFSATKIQAEQEFVKYNILFNFCSRLSSEHLVRLKIISIFTPFTIPMA